MRKYNYTIHINTKKFFYITLVIYLNCQTNKR